MLSFYSFLESIVPFKNKGRPPAPCAGCFFTDGNLYLAGYQPNKKIPCINGIGGRGEEGEEEVQTALRELVEELFDIHPVPPGLQEEIQKKIEPSLRICNEGYSILQYSFDDLESILKLIQSRGMQSKLYKEFPTTIGDLVLKRRVSTNSEISHLVLLPFISHSDGKEFIISSNLISDLKQLRSIIRIKNPLI